MLLNVASISTYDWRRQTSPSESAVKDTTTVSGVVLVSQLSQCRGSKRLAVAAENVYCCRGGGGGGGGGGLLLLVGYSAHQVFVGNH